jgi:hypothetical protein
VVKRGTLCHCVLQLPVMFVYNQIHLCEYGIEWCLGRIQGGPEGGGARVPLDFEK